MQETYETRVLPLGAEDPLEEGLATHCSILAWRIPWTEEPGGTVHRVAQSQTRLKGLSMDTLRYYGSSELLNLNSDPSQFILSHSLSFIAVMTTIGLTFIVLTFSFIILKFPGFIVHCSIPNPWCDNDHAHFFCLVLIPLAWFLKYEEVIGNPWWSPKSSILSVKKGSKGEQQRHFHQAEQNCCYKTKLRYKRIWRTNKGVKL